MNNFLYTVIVPIYGVEKYLNQCISSIVSQTYQNIEIILVDDGSKDNCPSICDEYAEKDSRIKVIHKTNGGLVSARKAGAEIAKGEYILCVDGDDWITDDYVEKFNIYIEKFSPDIVCCNHIITNDLCDNQKKCSIDLKEGFYDKKQIKEVIYPISISGKQGGMFPHNLWAKAIKKDIYINEQMNVDDSIKIGEDAAVVKPLLTKCDSVYIMDDYMYFYRYNLESMTKKKAFDMNFPLMLHEHLIGRINTQLYDFNNQINRWIFKELYTATVSQFNSNESFLTIRKNIIDSLNNNKYKEVLRHCYFDDSKNKLQLFLLKKHLILSLYLFNKILKFLKK